MFHGGANQRSNKANHCGDSLPRPERLSRRGVTVHRIRVQTRGSSSRMVGCDAPHPLENLKKSDSTSSTRRRMRCRNRPKVASKASSRPRPSNQSATFEKSLTPYPVVLDGMSILDQTSVSGLNMDWICEFRQVIQVTPRSRSKSGILLFRSIDPRFKNPKLSV